MRRAGLLGLLLAAASCSAVDKSGNEAKSELKATPPILASADTERVPIPSSIPFVRAASGATGYPMRSSIDTMQLFPVQALPHAEPVAESVEYCDSWGAFVPKSVAGKLVASGGWKITGEEQIGRLTAVSALRKYEVIPGGMCLAVAGFVALFEGSRVIGVLYRDEASHFPIGRIERLENGALRVWASTSQAPLGDLTFANGQIDFGTTAAMNTECNGRMKVPNLFRMPVEGARGVLFRAGWAPARADA